jgi:hypothetical protein
LSSQASIHWSRVKHNTFHSFPFYPVRSFKPRVRVRRCDVFDYTCC